MLGHQRWTHDEKPPSVTIGKTGPPPSKRPRPLYLQHGAYPGLGGVHSGSFGV